MTLLPAVLSSEWPLCHSFGKLLCHGMTADHWCMQVVVISGVLTNPAKIINSFQVCTSWVHVLDAVPWPGTYPSQNAIPDPTLGGRFPQGQQQQYPSARSLW